ncbi:calmodulin-like protein [Plasmodium falciparum NF54]|uniref:Calmodulin n=2 Tax=Plasmodium falciparum TaxID=5833 RepID=A0A143ZWH4_PLAF7|nr:calmodulin-like protein [Plasmodium falciparum 3D7]KAF4329968.1 calmodulin-like protein [Plasmodium falciparum NF54]PKC48805.1 calmodulin-like protein [Plasmodium falciparum NF54]CZT62498.1 calmodulin-like protein [Plasmodium falciparum 3D7]SOS76784.1 calmodulin-like protein [Plasmodium sp. gorilla clade G1]|eukprot:XP_024328995.1 calmodulin-like protein [Plasmodium falciparum 3D7]
MSKYFLSKQRRAEIESIFKEYDTNKDGVSGEKLLYLLRSLGIYLNKTESEVILEDYKKNGNINLSEFFELMKQYYFDENIENLLYLSLQSYAQEKSKTINLNEFKNVLLTLGVGIKLTEEEVDAFLNVEFNGYKNKEISFDDFIYKILKE